MESLIRIVLTDRTRPGMNQFLKLSKLSVKTLQRTCDTSKLTDQEFRDALEIDTDNQIIELFRNLISNPVLTREELQSIEFDKFNDAVQRCFLGLMLINNSPADLVCILLDQIKSVNYGNQYTTCKGLSAINPLIYCCCNNKFDIVKLLVERYNADIEHLSCNCTTAIMFSAEKDNIEITQYLYEKGAKLATPV